MYKMTEAFLTGSMIPVNSKIIRPGLLKVLITFCHYQVDLFILSECTYLIYTLCSS